MSSEFSYTHIVSFHYCAVCPTQVDFFFFLPIGPHSLIWRNQDTVCLFTQSHRTQICFIFYQSHHCRFLITIGRCQLPQGTIFILYFYYRAWAFFFDQSSSPNPSKSSSSVSEMSKIIPKWLLQKLASRKSLQILELYSHIRHTAL